MDKITAILALLSLAGNVFLTISWRKATAQALLADLYAKLLQGAAKRNTNLTAVVAEKEQHVRELEKAVLQHSTVPELVTELNRVFSKTAGDRKTGTLRPGKSSPGVP